MSDSEYDNSDSGPVTVDTLTAQEANDLQQTTSAADDAVERIKRALFNVYFDESMTREEASEAAYTLRDAAENAAEAMIELSGALEDLAEESE